MNKQFLDTLYKAKHEAQTALMELKEMEDFPKGGCSQEMHNCEVTELDYRLNFTESLIITYIDLHK